MNSLHPATLDEGGPPKCGSCHCKYTYSILIFALHGQAGSQQRRGYWGWGKGGVGFVGPVISPKPAREVDRGQEWCG